MQEKLTRIVKGKLILIMYMQQAIVLFILLLISGNSIAAQSGPQPLIAFEDQGQDFMLNDSKGQQHTLDDFKGKVVLVNFWASWCPPCIYEMPDLQKLQYRYPDEHFSIITINVGEKKYKVRKFTKLIDFQLPVLLDTSKQTFDEWDIEILPTSFLIDKQGRLRYLVRGNPGWHENNTLGIIESLLDEGSSEINITE